MTLRELRPQIDRDFWLEGFRDFLALESGSSANTVESYLRDLRRLGEFATSKGIRDPNRLTRPLLRDFVYLLKDLGLSAASIRRSVSAIRTYYGFLVGEGRVSDDPSARLGAGVTVEPDHEPSHVSVAATRGDDWNGNAIGIGREQGVGPKNRRLVSGE